MHMTCSYPLSRSHIAWCVSRGHVSWPEAQTFMQSRVHALQQTYDAQKSTGAPCQDLSASINCDAQSAQECVWLLEHSPLVTAGRAAYDQGLRYARQNNALPLYEVKRGGQMTYHGPGQRVMYMMLDLNIRTRDVRLFVQEIENMGIAALKECGIEAQRHPAGTGLWVRTSTTFKKIAAIGVHLSKWVTSYGIAFNMDPDLSHYQGFTPCGIKNFGVTSAKQLGLNIPMHVFDAVLLQTFERNDFLMARKSSHVK